MLFYSINNNPVCQCCAEPGPERGRWWVQDTRERDPGLNRANQKQKQEVRKEVHRICRLICCCCCCPYKPCSWRLKVRINRSASIESARWFKAIAPDTLVLINHLIPLITLVTGKGLMCSGTATHWSEGKETSYVCVCVSIYLYIYRYIVCFFSLWLTLLLTQS